MQLFRLDISIGAIIFTLLISLYLRFRWNHRYWQRRGIAQIKPNILFGNLRELFLGGKSLFQFFSDLYVQGTGEKFIGMYSFQRPVLIVRDPELIRLMLTKDFSYFRDRGFRLHKPDEPITDQLFSMEYGRWKILRRKLTPSFSSAKIKSMFRFVSDCCDELESVLENALSTIGNNDNKRRPTTVEVETKDLMARYTTDVISSCAFGVNGGSLVNPDAQFRKMGQKIFKERFGNFLIVALIDSAPWLISLLGIRFFEKDLTEFFQNSVAEVVDYRVSRKIVRGDFLDLLIAMKTSEESSPSQLRSPDPTGNRLQINGNEENDVEISLSVITAQCFLFFAAGFETSSSTLYFCIFEIAKNPEIQKNLQNELDTVAKQNEQLTYEKLNDLLYLEMVILETLRLYPPLYVLSRVCTQDYNIPETNVSIEKGTEIIIPLSGLQRDPQYYRNPKEFNPDHFTAEEKASRHSFSFIPFGEGPKICIGMRFGLMQIKLAVATILRKYNIALSPKTNTTINFVPITFVTNSRNDIFVRFSKRFKNQYSDKLDLS